MKNGTYELVVSPLDYPGKLYRGRYCYEHHLVWWQHTGEVLGPGEEIHHKNEHRRENRFGNLEKQGGILHRKYHGQKRHEASAVVLMCPQCDKEFKVYGHEYRTRKKQSKSGYLFCSRSCQSTWQHKRC